MQKSLEDLARDELFELTKERSRLRLLAIAIMGAVIPIFVSLLSLQASNCALNTHNLLAILLIGVSFVYLLLALLFLNFSRRYDQIVAYLQNISRDYEQYFDNRIHNRGASEKVSVSNFFSEYTWIICHFMIFIFPSLACFFVSFALLIRDSKSSTWIVFGSVGLANIIMLCAILRNWFEGTKNKKISLLTYAISLKNYAGRLLKIG